MNSILIDTSFLVALLNSDDHNHARTLAFTNKNDLPMRVPEVALTEVLYLINRAGGVPAKVKALRSILDAGLNRQSLEDVDIRRAAEIITRYPQANFDFVDVCLMALTERLDIRQVATFDRRDFSIFRPAHCDYLELLS